MKTTLAVFSLALFIIGLQLQGVGRDVIWLLGSLPLGALVGLIALQLLKIGKET